MQELLGSGQLEPNGTGHQAQADCLEPVELGEHSGLGLLEVAAGQDTELSVEAGGVG